MKAIIVLLLFVMTTTVVFSEPRTRIRPEPKCVPVSEQPKKDYLTWKIPYGTRSINIAYKDPKGRIIFDRDFDVDPNNSITIKVNK